MININGFYKTQKYWLLYKKGILAWEFVFDICKGLGAIWLVVEPTSFLFPNTEAPLKLLGWWFILASIIYAIWNNKPTLKFKFFLKDKNVFINIVIDDLFHMKDKDLIIPTNIHFVTDLTDDRISKSSVQGQFTKKYYNTHQHLDADIAKSLATTSFTALETPYLGKNTVYNLGTVAKLAVMKDGEKQFWSYLFALAKLSPDSICQSDIGEFQKTLPSLWNFIQTKGNLGDLAIPIIGSGFCRIDATIEELFREILESFLVASRNAKLCNSLTFVLYYKDVCNYNIDVESMSEFAKFKTSNFTKASQNSQATNQGQPVM